MRAGWRSCARFDCAALPPAPRAPATSPLTPELLAAWPPSLPREFRSVVLALGLASPRLAGASLLITKCRLCQTHYPPPERLHVKHIDGEIDQLALPTDGSLDCV